MKEPILAFWLLVSCLNCTHRFLRAFLNRGVKKSAVLVSVIVSKGIGPELKLTCRDIISISDELSRGFSEA